MTTVKMARMLMALMILLVALSGCRKPEVEGTVINIKSKRYDDALASAESAVQKYPGNGEAWFYYGWLQGDYKEDYAQMNDAFDKALALSPALVVTMDGAKMPIKDAVHQYRTNSFAKTFNAATKDLKKVQDGSMAEADKMPVYKEALSKLETAAAIAPDRFESYQPIAVIHLAMGDTATAEKILADAVSKFSDNTDLKIVAGEVFMRSNKLDDAAKYFNMAVESDPQNSDIYQKLGALESTRKNWDQANTYYQKAMEMDPNNANLAFNIGVSFFNQENYAEAVPFFEKAAENDPSNPTNHEILAKALIQAKQYDKAITVLEKATGNFQDNAAMWELLAVAYSQKGMGEKAENAFKRYKSLSTGM